MIIKINKSVSGGDNTTPYEGCENRQIESDRDGYDKLFNTTDEYKAYFQRREGSLNRQISTSSDNLLDSDSSRKLKRKTLSCSDLVHTLKGDVSIYPDGDIDFTRAAHDIDFSKRKTASLQDILSSYDVERPKSDVEFSRSVSWSNTLDDYEVVYDRDEFDQEVHDDKYDDYSRKCVDFDQKRKIFDLNPDDYNHNHSKHNHKQDGKQSLLNKFNQKFRQKRHHRTIEQLQALIDNQKELISKRKENEDNMKKKNKKSLQGLKGLNIQHGSEKKKNQIDNVVHNINENDDGEKRGRNVQKEIIKLEKNVIDENKYVEIMQRCKDAEKQGKVSEKNDEGKIDINEEQKVLQEKKACNQQKSTSDEEKIHLKEQFDENKLHGKEKVNKNENEEKQLQQQKVNDKNNENYKYSTKEEQNQPRENVKEEQNQPRVNKQSNQHEITNDEEKIHLKEQLKENEVHEKENKVNTNRNDKHVEIRSVGNDPVDIVEEIIECRRTVPAYEVNENIFADIVEGSEKNADEGRGNNNVEVEKLKVDKENKIVVKRSEHNDIVEGSEKNADEKRHSNNNNNVKGDHLNSVKGRTKKNVKEEELKADKGGNKAEKSDEGRCNNSVEIDKLNADKFDADENRSRNSAEKSEHIEDEYISKNTVSHLIKAFEFGKQKGTHNPVLPVIPETSEKSQNSEPVNETIERQETVPDFAVNVDIFETFEGGYLKGKSPYNIDENNKASACGNEKGESSPLVCVEPVEEIIDNQEIIPEFSINEDIFDIILKRTKKDKSSTKYKDNILRAKNMFYNAPVEHGLLPVSFEKPTVLFGKLTVRSGKPTTLCGNPTIKSEKPAIKSKKFADTFRKLLDKETMKEDKTDKEATSKRDPSIKPVKEVIECYNVLPNFTVDENIFDIMNNSEPAEAKPEKLSPTESTEDDDLAPNDLLNGNEELLPEKLSPTASTQEGDLLNGNEEFPRVVWSLNEEGIVHCEIDYQTKHLHDGIVECDQAKLTIPFDNTIVTEIKADKEVELKEEEFIAIWTHKDSYENKDKEEIVITQSIADRIKALMGKGQNTPFTDNSQNYIYPLGGQINDNPFSKNKCMSSKDQTNPSSDRIKALLGKGQNMPFTGNKQSENIKNTCMKNDKEPSGEKKKDEIFSKDQCMSPKDQLTPFSEKQINNKRNDNDFKRKPDTNLPKDDKKQGPNKNSLAKPFQILEKETTESKDNECSKGIKTNALINQLSNRETSTKSGSEKNDKNDIKHNKNNSLPKQHNITENDSTKPDSTAKANIRKFNLIIENDLIKPDSISEVNTCNPDSILRTDVTKPDLKSKPVVGKPDSNSKTDVKNLDLSSKPNSKEPDSTKEPANPKTDSISKPEVRKPDFARKPLSDTTKGTDARNSDLTKEPKTRNPDLMIKPEKQKPDSSSITDLRKQNSKSNSHPKFEATKKLDTKKPDSIKELDKQSPDSIPKPDRRKLDFARNSHPLLFDQDVANGRLPSHEHYKRLQLNFLNNIEELKLTLNDFSTTLSNSLSGLKTKKELLENEFSYAYGQEVQEKSVQTEACFYTGVDFV